MLFRSGRHGPAGFPPGVGLPDHALALDAARGCGALVVPTETVIYQMLGDSKAPGFKALLPLFK